MILRIRYRKSFSRTARCLLPAYDYSRPECDESVKQPWSSELPQVLILGQPRGRAND